VALEEPEIRRTNLNIPIDNNCIDDKLPFRKPADSDDHDDEGDKIDQSDAIPNTSGQWWAATELQRFETGTSDANRYEGDNGDNADADEEKEAWQADRWSTQNLEDGAPSIRDSGHSTRECEDWTVYFRRVKYDNDYANAMASDIFEAKTALSYLTRTQT